MDDDGIFVCLSLKDMRSPGQQYGPVCSERAWAGIQGNIGLQLLLQQPGQITWHEIHLSEVQAQLIQNLKLVAKPL